MFLGLVKVPSLRVEVVVGILSHRIVGTFIRWCRQYRARDVDGSRWLLRDPTIGAATVSASAHGHYHSASGYKKREREL